MKLRTLWGAVALSVAAVQAHASDANFWSETTFSTFMDDGVTVEVDMTQGGPYINFDPVAIGDGVNDDNLFDRGFDAPSGYVFAHCQSTATTGFATQFQGMNYFLIFTNTTDDTLNFGIEATNFATVVTNGTAQADSYGGVFEYGGTGSFSYFHTQSLNGGAATFDGVGFFNEAPFGSQSYSAQLLLSDSLEAGESRLVQVWASGSTLAGSVVPEPASLTALALGGLALLRKRKK